MKLDVIPTLLEGCVELRPPAFRDDRGVFVKTFERATFTELGLPGAFDEICYSVSRAGVMRGMHFQAPPHEHGKLVTCVAGRVLDAIVDLRVSSPTYRQHILVELDAAKANIIYVPAGLAHGFFTRSESATMLYAITGLFSAAHDGGIRWDSAGIVWPADVRDPIVSERDARLPALADYESPFA